MPIAIFQFLPILFKVRKMFFACCLLFLLDNPKEQFLQFASSSTNEYLTTFDSGVYRQINVHRRYTQVQQVRFNGIDYASELSICSSPIDDLSVNRWLENDFVPPTDSLQLTATTGNNEDYRFALKYDGGQRDVSSVSEVVVYTKGVDDWSMYPGIYEPIMLGRFGRIDDAVRRGDIDVVTWAFDDQSGCWRGEFRSIVDDERYILVFDPKTTWLKSRDASKNGIDQYRMEFEYRDKSLSCLKIFQGLDGELSGKRKLALSETIHFSSVVPKPIDKSTMRLAHYGHPEPPTAPKQTTFSLQLIAWVLLPVVGLILMFTARNLTNKRQSIMK